MKIRILLTLSAALMLSACATSTVKPAIATEADSAAAYIYAVENAAFGRATRILWVNPPRNKDLEGDGKG